MSIEEMVYASLSTVMANVHAVELPAEPQWPALVFEVHTEPEKGWVAGGGYDQHDILVSTLSPSKLDIVKDGGYRDQIRAAIEALPGFLGDEFSGDADYEGDANVYAYVQNFRVRTRRQ